jgi:hypothetical protein
MVPTPVAARVLFAFQFVAGSSAPTLRGFPKITQLESVLLELQLDFEELLKAVRPIKPLPS